jgi:phage gp16-like protein
MVVNPLAPDERSNYRQEAIARIHTAVRTMLDERAKNYLAVMQKRGAPQADFRERTLGALHG